MRSRSLVGIAVAVASLAACSARTEGPAAASADLHDAPAAASASTIAAAASAPPMATATAAATTAAASEEPPPSAETLARLPPGAAMYFAVRPGDISKGLAKLPGVQEGFRQLVHEISHGHGDPSPEVALAAAGVDVRRPILGAVAPASEKSARSVIDALVKGASNTAREKLVREHAGDATRVRLLVPLAKGEDARIAAATLAKGLTREANAEVCTPAVAACAGFGADAPLLVSLGTRTAVVAYADGADLRLDLVVPLFVPATDPAALAALIAFRGSRGGFEGRCSRFDAGATASLCVDAGPAGDLGTTMGYSGTFLALTGGAVDAKMVRRIAEAGRAESQRNLELAAPARRLASDGTLVISTRGEPGSAFVTWALTDTSRAPIEKAFAEPRCAQGRAVITELLPALRKAFNDPGPGFTDPRKTFEAFREAGWGAYPIVLSGTWPNLLDILTGPLGKSLDFPATVQVCARHDAGRLTLAVKASP